jgi:hypothetical protein
MNGPANSFGFGEAVQEASIVELPPVRAKRVDRQRSEEGRAVAAEEGFHRRAPVQGSAKRASAAPTKKAVGRVRLTEAAPRRGPRFQGEARVQLNMQAPVPVAEAWRKLMDEAPIGQWELLEAAIPLLRKHLGIE